MINTQWSLQDMNCQIMKQSIHRKFGEATNSTTTIITID